MDKVYEYIVNIHKKGNSDNVYMKISLTELREKDLKKM